MKLIWHVTKKDLRAHGMLIILFAALIATKLLVGAFWFATDGGLGAGGGGERVYPLVVNLTLILEVFVGYILIAALVQEDSLVQSNAFWLTRPISSARLMLAKGFALMLVLGVLPLIVTLPWWLVNGFGPREVLAAALETALWHGLVVLMGWPFAVLSATYGRYIVLTLVAFLFVLVSVILKNANGGDVSAGVAPGVVETRGWLMLALVVATVAGVVIHQYLTRRFSRSVAIGISGAIAAFGILSFWPWDWAKPFARAGSRHSQDISIAFERAHVVPGSLRPQVETEVTISGVPERYAVGGGQSRGGVRHEWTWTDGTKAVYFGPIVRATEMRESEAGAGAVTNEPPHDDWRVVSRVIVPPDRLSRFEQEPATYTLEMRLALLEKQKRLEMPLTDGATVEDGDQVVRIVEIDHEKKQLVVAERAAAWGMRNASIQVGTTFSPTGGGPRFVLSAASGVLATPTETQVQSVRIGGVGQTWRRLSFASEKNERVRGAFDQAILMREDYREVERFSRKVVVKNFTPSAAGP